MLVFGGYAFGDEVEDEVDGLKEHYDVVVVAVSSYGEGEPPDSVLLQRGLDMVIDVQVNVKGDCGRLDGHGVPWRHLGRGKSNET